MATTFVFDRGSQYGESEFLGNIDVGCEDLTPEQMDLIREKYISKVKDLVSGYDPTLTWFPYLSEVWGEVGNTESDPWDFREWWKNGDEEGRWENAFLDAYNEVVGE